MAVNARDLFTRFANAVNTRDKTTLESMFHPQFTAVAPQSGERSVGFEGFWAQIESYPGGVPEMPALPETRLLGDDDRWAITPAYTVVPLATPNQFTILAAAAYPDGQRWHTISMVELRDTLIYRMEFFYAPELPAPLSDSIAAYGRG